MLTITIDGVDQTYRVEVGDGIGSLLTMADHGEVGTGQILIDDPDGNLTFNGWREAYVEEDECVAQPRVWTGYVFIRTISRGRDSFRTSDARLVACDINDLNATAGLKAWTTADAKRPYESEATRMAALLASECMAGLIYDNGLVNAGAEFADEADFRRQFAGQVLASMAYSGKNWYVYRDHDYGQASLFYDLPDAAIRECTLRISNVIGDQDGDTLYPYRDAELTRDPSEVYSRYWIEYKGGAVVMGTNPATEATYIDRDGGYTSTRIGRQATAEAQLAIELDIHGTEQDRIPTTVFVPAAQLGLIEAGQLIDVRFTHLPGYETFTPQRIVSCDVQRFNATEEAYEVRLELTLAKRAGSPGGGGDFPLPPPGDCVGLSVSGLYINFPDWTAAHNGLRFSSNDVGHVKEWAAWVALEDDETADHLNGETIIGGVFADSTDGDGAGLFNGPNDTIGPFSLELFSDTAVTLYVFAMVTQPSNLLYHDGGACNSHIRDGSGSVIPGLNVTDVATGVSASNIPFDTPILVGKVEVTYDFAPACAGQDNPPLPGQWVYRDVPTPANGVAGTTFTTTYPFADGSLRIRLDEMEQTPGIVTYDGTTGEFTLAFDVEVGEQLSVDYQGR